MDESSLPKAPLPPVQRLSRGVLVVMAGLVTVTLLAVAFLSTPRTIERPAAAARPVAGGQPGFLARPPAAAPGPNPQASEQELLERTWEALRRAGGGQERGGRGGGGIGEGEVGEGRLSGGRGDAGDGDSMGMASREGGEGGDGGVGDPRSGRGFGGPGAAGAPAGAGGGSGWLDSRREAFLRALRAPLTVAAPGPALREISPWPALPAPEWLGLGGAAAIGGSRGGAGGGAVGAGGGGVPAAARGGGIGGQAGGGGGGAEAETTSAGAEGAGSDGKRAEVAGSRGASAAEAERGGPAAMTATAATAAMAVGAGAAEVVRSRGGAVVPAGTVVSALLLTAVNSDLPGTLIAQVSRDVYDLRQQTVVLPRGTRLLGRYNNQVAVGQQRLLVAWTRVQLLDGTLLDLPGLAGATSADPSGAAGLPAQVNNHVLRVFGDAVLLSLLSAGADLSQPASQGALAAPSAGSVASSALGLQLSEAGTQLLRRDLDIRPTLSLPAGTALAIFVNADLPLPALPVGSER